MLQRKDYVMNMLGSIPHQKFYFNHLPTRGRAGIKLGDADTSPTYLQFLIVPCYYIIILGCFTIILQKFYIIFGTDLLTQCPVPVVVFCLFFTSQEINIKRSPKAAELFVNFLLDQKTSSGTKKYRRGSHLATNYGPVGLQRTTHASQERHQWKW